MNTGLSIDVPSLLTENKALLDTLQKSSKSGFEKFKSTYEKIVQNSILLNQRWILYKALQSIETCS
jgi:hypothetical protein